MTTAFLKFLWAQRAVLGLMLLFGLIYAWHRDQVSDAYETALAEAKTTADKKARDDLISAQENWIANVSMLGTLAAVDDAAQMKRLTSIERALHKLNSEYSSHEVATPLPVDCVADPVRVRRVNQALGH